MPVKKILCVDDEEDILELLEASFSKDDYLVSKTTSAVLAYKKIISIGPDLVFLDVMMPEKDGLELCKEIRSNKNIKQPHIFFLTAKSEEIDEVLGLEIGADDYILKPFSPRKINSKVKALFRQLDRIDEKNKSSDIQLVKGIEVNRISYTVEIDKKEIRFLRKEFDLLHFLMSRPGIVFSRNELLQNVWGEDAFFVERTVDVHITKIRKKISPYSKQIQTVAGVGYKFISQ
jgi:DNA-binding response OmpR family regulator